MRRTGTVILGCVLLCGGGVSCKRVEKEITVITREKGSGTREAFDRAVTDGNGNFLEMKIDGKKVYKTTLKANELTKTSFVTSSVATDKNAIGYVSLGSVDDSVKVLKIGGVAPTAAAVKSGEYGLQRPFVVMTNERVTFTARTADFLSYLYSAEAEAHAETTGYIFLSDPVMRAGGAGSPVEVYAFKRKASLPDGEKIVVRGSTSVEKFINAAAKGYAEGYGVKPTALFDIQLEGSSVGRKAVEEDVKGNVIGLSSAAVRQDGIRTFNVCLDAVAVIVNKANSIEDLSVEQLYDIYAGKTTKFRLLEGNT